ncbi:DNA-binding protein [Dissulfurirhabdus thermomarina]|uniref:DNA-binding protein n=1 Tax=Dissulfurirhabdus thermomarina TaxID=1765737 RepID=A0A6N9TPP0_DISTH|nr:DNA-binding protein [Dissulfurirhabdus thermomarina]NDY43241.1 DNA-binding protein [Dissulfurirhabdus thermomarina]NMX23433.1 DNA-binding protein [Dissulfurirhabdus thermomarina]
MKRGIVFRLVQGMMVLVLVLAGAACQRQEAASSKGGAGQGEAAAPAAAGLIRGTVVETMNSGGYTYLRLDTGTGKVWVAVREMKAAVGDRLTLKPGTVMHDFQSRTLNRTFPEIVFSEGPADGPGATAPAPEAGMGSGTKASAGGHPLTPRADVHVLKAEGEHAYTVAEIHAGRDRLAGKKVRVRGQVVKVSPNIMGRNWIHLQDGTGDETAGTYDLTVTSADLPAKGEVVTVEGTLAVDKDFGAGYRYGVIVEGAKVTR